jgi:bifunctional non-homologous end joining protein LigD
VPRPITMQPIPAVALPRGPGWVYEPKWDGFRALLKAGSPWGLASRKGNSLARRFPELEAATAALPPGTVLDGEVVALVDGRVDFPALLAGRGNVAFIAFDVLRVGRVELRARPWIERRRRLEQLVFRGARWATVDVYDDGEALLAGGEAIGIEGVVAKRREAPYVLGEAPAWVKVKTEAWRAANAARWKRFA